jgi:hypothetical protein
VQLELVGTYARSDRRGPRPVWDGERGPASGDGRITLDGTEWEQVAIVRYPSRAKFFEMAQDEEFRARAIHKDAGVEKSLVIVAHLQDTVSPPAPEEVPNPATPADPPVALEQGVNPIAWFDIEGVFIGDEREWDEFRINLFPSHAAFETVVADPTRRAGQVHREAALEDTYTIVLPRLRGLPTVRRLGVHPILADGSTHDCRHVHLRLERPSQQARWPHGLFISPCFCVLRAFRTHTVRVAGPKKPKYGQPAFRN